MNAGKAARDIDLSPLESLMGYNARRVSMTVVEAFAERMKVYDLKPAYFSVLLLAAHNPGIVSRQLCACLAILPPNLVGIVNDLQDRGLIVKRPHPHDGRALGLHVTPAGHKLIEEAERTAKQLEADVARALTPAENDTLIRLLKKVAGRV